MSRKKAEAAETAAARKKFIETLDAVDFSVETVRARLAEKVTIDPLTGLNEEEVVAVAAESIVAYFEAQRTRKDDSTSGSLRWTRYDWDGMTQCLQRDSVGKVDIGVYNPKDRSKADFTFNLRNRLSVQRYDLMRKGDLSEVESFCVEARTPLPLTEEFTRELVYLIGKQSLLLPWRTSESELPVGKISFCRPESKKRVPRSRRLIQADRRSHIRDNLRSCGYRLRQHNYAENPCELLDKADYHLKLYKGPEAEEALKQTQQLREDYEKAEAEIARIVSDLEARFRALSSFVGNMV